MERGMQIKPFRRSECLSPSSLVEKPGRTCQGGKCWGKTPVVAGDGKCSDPLPSGQWDSCTRGDVRSRQTVYKEPDRKYSWLSGPHHLCCNHPTLPSYYKSGHRRTVISGCDCAPINALFTKQVAGRIWPVGMVC